jgi:hypothetical protein
MVAGFRAGATPDASACGGFRPLREEQFQLLFPALSEETHATPGAVIVNISAVTRLDNSVAVGWMGKVAEIAREYGAPRPGSDFRCVAAISRLVSPTIPLLEGRSGNRVGAR